MRFCEIPIAFLEDIEATFCQVRVSLEHHNLLRFLWIQNGDYDKPTEEYQMLIHLFGGTFTELHRVLLKKVSTKHS